jgi:hypothetical protein
MFPLSLSSGWPGRLLLPLLAVLAGTSAPAFSHPHAFIDASVEIVFDPDGQLSAIHQRWAFDTTFGDAVRLQGDSNHDRTLDEAELVAVADYLARGFAPYDFYTHVVVDGASVPLGTPTEMRASVEDYRLHYEFTIPVVTPVAIEKGAGIDIADFEINFAVAWVSPPLSAVNLPPGCVLARRDRADGDPALAALLAQSGVHTLEPDPAAGYDVRAVIGCF